MRSQFGFSVDLFYSYSHKDTEYREKMEKSLALLRDQDNILKTWSDECIRPGQNISEEIKQKIESTDIIVFLVSQSFIASKECRDEWIFSCEVVKRNSSIIRIPIILSDCPWEDLEGGMSRLKALPKDAKPILEFDNMDTAWHQIYKGLKDVIEDLQNQFTMKETFRKDMEETEFLSQKRIKLSDIFVFPSMCSYTTKDKDNDVEVSIRNEDDLLKNSHTLIHGERLSGKTTLCRHLFFTLADSGKPVLYIDLDKVGKKAKPDIFTEAYGYQFRGDYSLWKNKKDKVVILDNLSPETIDHVMLAVELFDRVILATSSDIFYAYYKDESRLSQFRETTILPLTHSKQEKLIRKRSEILNRNQPVLHGDIDRLENRVNAIILSDKIFPRYPFYVLSILQTYEGYMQYDLSITSYGHCYYAIIIAHLIKSGISRSDDEIGACLNFAENFAFAIYQSNSIDITSNNEIDFTDHFIQEYKKRFVPLQKPTLKRLFNSQYGILSDAGHFTKPYMYYYFLGKYFAKNMKNDEDVNKIVQDMIDCSYLKSNRLTLIFIIHHTNDDQIIDDILLRTMCALDNLKASTLDRDEVDVFQELVNAIPPQALSDESIPSQRDKERQARDRKDHTQDFDGSEISEINEMYKIMKNNEILGQILRNKYGSLERDKILEIIETVADGGLRLVQLLLIDKDELNDLAAYLSEKNSELELDQVKRILRILSFIWTMINIQKIVVALNKPEIASFVKDVVSQKDTPAYDLVGYFLRLDTMRKFSDDDKEKLKALIKKHDYPFFKKIISIRTKSYLNTHSVEAPLEQAVCSLLDIKYKQRLKKLASKAKK